MNNLGQGTGTVSSDVRLNFCNSFFERDYICVMHSRKLEDEGKCHNLIWFGTLALGGKGGGAQRPFILILSDTAWKEVPQIRSSIQ